MADEKCSGREGKYEPWSWGEVFRCTTCGQQLRQSPNVQPLTQDAVGYDALYPIPVHVAAASLGGSR